jgi:hypothetical protein
MLEMNCYKMFRIAKMFAESEIACQAEGGTIAKPITLLQVRTSIGLCRGNFALWAMNENAPILPIIVNFFTIDIIST